MKLLKPPTRRMGRASRRTKRRVDSADGRVNQSRATLTRMNNILSKTTYDAPFDGTVTNLPVHEGETVVMEFRLPAAGQYPDDRG